MEGLVLVCESGHVCLTHSQREKDLDVSAKIGETLLRRSELLERDLTTALDTRLGSEQHLAQLRHELGQKDDLLKLYARQEKEREFTAAGSTEDR